MKNKINIGDKIGNLTIISNNNSIIGGDSVKRKWRVYECVCDCGKRVIVKGSIFNTDHKSCGCMINKTGRSLVPGNKFNRLTTITYKGNSKWLCRCECGQVATVKTENLINGNTKSCGCLNVESSIKKIDKLIEGKRKYEPKIASARVIWRRSYKEMDFYEFYKKSQMNCYYCNCAPSKKYNYFMVASTYSSEKSRNDGMFIYNILCKKNNCFIVCCEVCKKQKAKI